MNGNKTSNRISPHHDRTRRLGTCRRLCRVSLPEVQGDDLELGAVRQRRWDDAAEARLPALRLARSGEIGGMEWKHLNRRSTMNSARWVVAACACVLVQARVIDTALRF